MNTIEIADVEARDADGWTALMRAAKNGDADVVLALLERGADVFARNDAGHTAMDIAMENNEIVIINMLDYFGIE